VADVFDPVCFRVIVGSILCLYFSLPFILHLPHLLLSCSYSVTAHSFAAVDILFIFPSFNFIFILALEAKLAVSWF
jgi:hypothetical protein